MAYKIVSRLTTDAPVTATPGTPLPIPWDDLLADHKKRDTKINQMAEAYLPVKEFWVADRREDPTTIKVERLKERVRQSFYGWRTTAEAALNKGAKKGAKPKFIGVGITFGEEWNKEVDPKQLVSITVYLQDQPDEFREAARERAKVASATRTAAKADTAGLPKVADAIMSNGAAPEQTPISPKDVATY